MKKPAKPRRSIWERSPSLLFRIVIPAVFALLFATLFIGSLENLLTGDLKRHGFWLSYTLLTGVLAVLTVAFMVLANTKLKHRFELPVTVPSDGEQEDK